MRNYNMNEQYIEYCFRDFDLLDEYRKVHRRYMYASTIGILPVLLGIMLCIFFLEGSENVTLCLIIGATFLAVYLLAMIIVFVVIIRKKREILRRSAETMPQDEDGKLRLKLIEYNLHTMRRLIPLAVISVVFAGGIVFLPYVGHESMLSFIGVGALYFVIIGILIFFSFRYRRRQEEIVGAIQRLKMQNGKDERL